MILRILLALLATVLVLLGLTYYIGVAEDSSGGGGAAVPGTPEQIAKGAYLARAGNCMACHTARGGAAYAGGRPIDTPFGVIYSSNITPDAATGIGAWNADDFWRALHNGKSRDGRLLYPAFPYPNYTKVTRDDADAMYAYLRTLAPARQPNREHALRFPYNHRVLLAGWRALYFRPGVYQPQAARPQAWNRGAYLVQGLGHCNACHTARNVFGATLEKEDLGGAMLTNWYSPSLTAGDEAGLGDWDMKQIVDLLKTGVAEPGIASGPMAEVVRESLQYLSEEDVAAMGSYLQSLPQADTVPAAPDESSRPEIQALLKRGAGLYEQHCANCHRENGEGRPPHFPALAGNRSVVLQPAINSLRLILHGGYPPSTAGNPYPYGMPAFAPLLNDEEVAAVATYIRSAWGNRGSLISPAEVGRYRSVPLE